MHNHNIYRKKYRIHTTHIINRKAAIDQRHAHDTRREGLFRTIWHKNRRWRKIDHRTDAAFDESCSKIRHTNYYPEAKVLIGSCFRRKVRLQNVGLRPNIIAIDVESLGENSEITMAVKGNFEIAEKSKTNLKRVCEISYTLFSICIKAQ